MTRLPIDLPLRTVSTKVSAGAWERAKALKERHGARLSDIVSACLLHMSEEELVKILAEQKAAFDKLPRAIKGMLRNIDKLSDEDREALREILSPPQK